MRPARSCRLTLFSFPQIARDNMKLVRSGLFHQASCPAPRPLRERLRSLSCCVTDSTNNLFIEIYWGDFTRQSFAVLTFALWGYCCSMYPCFVSLWCLTFPLLIPPAVCANQTHRLRAELGQNACIFISPLFLENLVFSVNFSFLCTFGWQHRHRTSDLTYTDRRRWSLAFLVPAGQQQGQNVNACKSLAYSERTPMNSDTCWH